MNPTLTKAKIALAVAQHHCDEDIFTRADLAQFAEPEVSLKPDGSSAFDMVSKIAPKLLQLEFKRQKERAKEREKDSLSWGGNYDWKVKDKTMRERGEDGGRTTANGKRKTRDAN